MRIRTTNSLAIMAVLATSACAQKEIAVPPPPEVAVMEKQDSPDRLERSNAIALTAVVTNIDVNKRLVTLKGHDGNEETIEVGPEVRNLAQVKRGDEVVVTYYESVVFQLRKPGEAEPGVSAASAGDRAQPGSKPGGVEAEAVTITATVVAVDKAKPSLTLKRPDGKVVTLPVRDAKRLDPVKVGDLLEITYKQALAVSVEKPQ